jgi:hypothetical protein
VRWCSRRCHVLLAGDLLSEGDGGLDAIGDGGEVLRAWIAPIRGRLSCVSTTIGTPRGCAPPPVTRRIAARSAARTRGAEGRRAAWYRSAGWATDHRNTSQASWWVGRRGFSDSGRPREAAPSAARVAAACVRSWSCAWSPGSLQGLRGPGSAFAVATLAEAPALLLGDH